MKEIVELINKVTRKPNKTFSVPSKLALLVFCLFVFNTPSQSACWCLRDVMACSHP